MQTIKVFDNFLSKKDFQSIRDYATGRALFTEYPLGGDTGHMRVAEVSPGQLHTIYRAIEKENHTRTTHIAGYFRLNTELNDKFERVHCDYDILGQKPNRASVLYLVDEVPWEARQQEAGTAFWSHERWGKEFRGTAEENQELLWQHRVDDYDLEFSVNVEPNRLVSYPTSYFHSRYPGIGWGTTAEDGRLVIVLFYNEEKVT